MLARSASSSSLIPPVPSRTSSDELSAVSATELAAGFAASASVASQAVTSITRSWPAFAAAPVRAVLIDRVPSAGPSSNVPSIVTRVPIVIRAAHAPDPGAARWQ